MKRHQNLHYLLAAWLLLACLTLTACSVPDASTVLRKAEQTKISSFKLQVDDHYYNHKGQPVEFSGTIRYQKKPFVMWTDLKQTGDQHVKMWVTNRYAYLNLYKDQHQAWYKAKASQYVNIGQFQQVVSKLDTLPLSAKSRKLFKVARNGKAGYVLTYSGKSKALWRDLNQSHALAPVSGNNSVTKSDHLTKLDMTIAVNQHYQLTGFKLTARYQAAGKTGSTKVAMSTVNQTRLAIPKSVLENSVDITKANK